MGEQLAQRIDLAPQFVVLRFGVRGVGHTSREKTPLFYIHVASGTAGIIYSVGPKPVQLIVPAAPSSEPSPRATGPTSIPTSGTATVVQARLSVPAGQRRARAL